MPCPLAAMLLALDAAVFATDPLASVLLAMTFALFAMLPALVAAVLVTDEGISVAVCVVLGVAVAVGSCVDVAVSWSSPTCAPLAARANAAAVKRTPRSSGAQTISTEGALTWSIYG